MYAQAVGRRDKEYWYPWWCFYKHLVREMACYRNVSVLCPLTHQFRSSSSGNSLSSTGEFFSRIFFPHCFFNFPPRFLSPIFSSRMFQYFSKPTFAYKLYSLEIVVNGNDFPLPVFIMTRSLCEMLVENLRFTYACFT